MPESLIEMKTKCQSFVSKCKLSANGLKKSLGILSYLLGFDDRCGADSEGSKVVLGIEEKRRARKSKRKMIPKMIFN